MKLHIYTLISCLLILLGTGFVSGQTYGNWTLVGPNLFPNDIPGQINGIGRIEQIKFDPLNTLKMYAASSSGGLFVSTDSANTWKVTSTDSVVGFGTQDRVASICIDYTNDNILYVGTGDANYYDNNVGVWKSTDAGATWAAANTGMGNNLPVEILMSPHDHNTLIAATSGGIWKTTNAGASWTETHIGGQFTDMQFKPSPTTSTIYATTDSAFLVSTDVGTTWTKISLPINLVDMSNGGRIGVSKADSDIVYVTYVGDDSANCAPLIKSTNSGQSFTIIKPADKCDLNGYDTNSLGSYYQGNYNYCIAVDPANINTIYIAAECVWKSTDGGVHWLRYNNWPYGVHCDMHYLSFSPIKTTELFCANDGGVFKTLNGSVTWTAVSNGIAASECYHAATSLTKDEFMVAGLQDNGGIFYNNTEPFSTFWAGDVTDPFFTVYADSTMFYDLNDDFKENTTSSNTLNMPFGENEYEVMTSSPAKPNTAFIADSDVYISTAILANPPTWTKISNINIEIAALASSPAVANDLYMATYKSKFYYTANALAKTPVWTNYKTPGSTANAACIAPVKSDTNVVYMSCGSTVYRSANKGSSWTNVTANLPTVNVENLYNDVSSTNEAMYLATADAVWYKDNTMTNWLNFTKGLPVCYIDNLMMYNDGTSNSRVRVAFYGRGIWESPLYSASSPTGVNSIVSSPTVKTYPNPSTGIFTVAIQGLTEKAYIAVFDMLGQCIYQKPINSAATEINIASQPAGIYLCRIISDEGAFIASSKIVKE